MPEEFDAFDQDIVSVVDGDGKEHMFEELDRIEMDTGRYVALLPLYDDAQQMLEESGELIILQVMEEDGETYLTPIEEEEIFMEVGQVFEDRLSELYEFEQEEEARDDALPLS